MILVSALFAQRDGRSTRSIDSYFNHFIELANCNHTFIVFIDSKLSPPKLNNVEYIKTELSELIFFKKMNSATKIEIADNPYKNTLDYHIINSSKVEFCHKASCFYPEIDRFSWIDFGINHFIKDKKSYKQLDNIPFLSKGIVIPGCWNWQTNFLSPVSWRFCGSFFSGDKNSIKDFYHQLIPVVENNLPTATWEVNSWAKLEYENKFPFLWYKANHDDSIFNFNKYLLK